ncbi:MAG: outer membrane protein assembly factor [Proteobacteria bacterium]|nr:outer membrane protein assembly factor [Pseudomonadota bacterium]
MAGYGADRRRILGDVADGRSLALRFDTYWSSLTNQISQGVGDLRYTSPTFLATPWILTENLRFQRLDLPTLPYNLDRLSVASYLTRTTEEDLTLSLGHTIFQENLNDVDPGAILSGYDSGSLQLSILGATAVLDRRDNPLNPSAGYYTSLDYRIASEALASDANFHSVMASGSFVEPLSIVSPSLRFALNARAGSSWAFGGSPAIPISQRYFLGGRTTVRGYKENSLGPRGEDDSVIGGDLMLLGNTELRYSLSDAVVTHIFLDSGSVFLRDQGISLGDLRYSTGAGVRYLSPIGPIGVEVGCPIDRRSGESAYRIHFTIGNNF